MPDRPIDERLAELIAHLQNVKLGPGVVGRNATIGWALELVALVGVIGGIVLHSIFIVGISIGCGFIGAIFIVSLNAYFGMKNPAAALLEGAEFLEYSHMEMAAKGVPRIESSTPPTPKPPELPTKPDPALEAK